MSTGRIRPIPIILTILIAAAAGRFGFPYPRPSPPGERAPVVAPKLRFGKGRLLTPTDIRLSGNELIVLDEVAPMNPEDNVFVVFGLDGRFKSQFGRGGQGPGEFGQAHAFEVKGNILYVLDSFKQCIQLFSAADKSYLRTIRYGSEQVFTTPHDFAVLDGGGFVLAKIHAIRGNKALFPVGPDGKPGTAFLDVNPAFENEADFRAKANNPDPETCRKDYSNLGYLESTGQRIYYLPWLKNEILAFHLDGKPAGRIALPLTSIETTVKIVKENGFLNIERRLNYGLACDGDRLWVVSRDEDGMSILYEISAGQVTERLRAKEALEDFAVAGQTLYATDQESGEVLVYAIPSVR